MDRTFSGEILQDRGAYRTNTMEVPVVDSDRFAALAYALQATAAHFYDAEIAANLVHDSLSRCLSSDKLHPERQDTQTTLDFDAVVINGIQAESH